MAIVALRNGTTDDDVMLGQTDVQPAWRLVAIRLSARPASVIVAATALLGLAYLLRTPQVPDLAAQVARAEVARTQGVTTWWSGWYGGISLPTYSLLSPSIMAAVGTPLTGVVAIVATAAAAPRLTAGCLRPRLGAAAVAIFSLADLLDGRVTFAAGVAFASWAAVSIRSSRLVPTLAFSLAAYAVSPLAGLFLGIVLGLVAVAQPGRRTAAAVSATSLLGLGIGTAVFFPDTGTMPFTIIHALPPAACCLAVLILCPVRLVRAVAIALLVLFVVCLVVPSPVGGNITRLVWLAAVPTVVACAPAPRWMLPLLACALAIWPSSDLIGQLHAGAIPSAKAAFYQPLLNELRSEQTLAGADSSGQRLELVDTVNHWGDAYLSSLPLARGWDRQADVGHNHLFYDRQSLSAATYRTWLDSLAVRWVAVPSAPLDYASVAEATLIRSGLTYLELVWSTTDWKLYEVVDPTPLISGAQLLSVSDTSIKAQTAGAATVTVRERWSPYIVLTDVTSGQGPPGCVVDHGGWVTVVVSHAESFELSNRFQPAARFSAGSGCNPGANGR